MVSLLTKVPFLGKIIEIIIGQKVTKNKTSSKDLMKGVISTLALFLFSYEPNKHTGGVEATDTAIHIGYTFLVISLLTDALLSLKEKLITKKVEEHPEFGDYKHMISWYSMFILNISVVVISIPMYCKYMQHKIYYI